MVCHLEGLPTDWGLVDFFYLFRRAGTAWAKEALCSIAETGRGWSCLAQGNIILVPPTIGVVVQTSARARLWTLLKVQYLCRRCFIMKAGGQTRTQFGVRVSASHKVARSLFPETFRQKIVRKPNNPPDEATLSSTSEITKNWNTTGILERETENNLDVFQLIPGQSANNVAQPTQRTNSQPREAKVVDIFDQCLKQYRRKRPEARPTQRDSQPRNKSKRS